MDRPDARNEVRWMKHFTRVPCHCKGAEIFRLIDAEGDVVEAFDHYARELVEKDFAAATIKRYLEVVANFLNYLTEAGVYGMPVAQETLNKAIDSYISIRTQADRLRVSTDEADAFVRRARPIVVALDLHSVRAVDNMAAAINLFLRLSEALARTEWERAALYGLDRPPGDYADVINAIGGYRHMPYADRKALMQGSMLANVMRMNPGGILKPRGLSAGRRRPRFTDEENLEFPIHRFADLIAAANTHRDAAWWLLQGGGGVRTSEAGALRWPQIDIARQKVYVDDPNGLRYADELPLEAKMRFKGRAVSEVYLFPPIRGRFFEALRLYVEQEYVPGSGHEFVFQDVRRVPQRGRPFYKLSDTARNETFKRAVARADITHPIAGKSYTPHSLRHMYGVYMRNYFPVPGGYGLEVEDVQKLMGHLTDTAARHYARRDRTVLAAKLEYADQVIFPGADTLEGLPTMIADRLRDEADRIEGVLRQ